MGALHLPYHYIMISDFSLSTLNVHQNGLVVFPVIQPIQIELKSLKKKCCKKYKKRNPCKRCPIHAGQYIALHLSAELHSLGLFLHLIDQFEQFIVKVSQFIKS